MQEIVGVKFKKLGKIYFFNPNGFSLEKGKGVIVETARGLEYGEVAIGNSKISEEKIVAPLKIVVRIATDEDKKIFEEKYPGQAEMVKDFWMPNKEWEGCDVNDPSARVLSNYGDSGK